ncbi:HVO_0234 family beta-propeller protein [Natronomonas sp. EA1]|uniref:HVO_0234 family beta-propeller protein n=1 Tax=Natronomonas sp. EA1 TaxID=3421655 RepID=UPI003EBF493F
MSAEKDISLEEKRVYAAKQDATDVFVATGAGLARVTVSADLVGEFGLEYRGPCVDVTATGRVAIATPEDVLLAGEDGFVETGFGPASAVSYGEEGLVAAGDGRVATREEGDWTTLAEIDDVRAIDGDLVAAKGGVFRLDGTHVGLSAVNDIAVGEEIWAATDDGLYWLGNGWMDALEGEFTAVATAGDRVHAATAETLYERADGEWREVEAPAGIVDVGYGDAVYAVTESGTFLADAGDGFRDRLLGLPDVRALSPLV